MIHIFLSDKAYENDVFQIVRMFYPGEEVKLSEEVIYPIEACMGEVSDSIEKTGKTVEAREVRERLRDVADEQDGLERLSVSFEADRIRILVLFRTGRKLYRTVAVRFSQETKSKYKNSLKRLLYGILSEATGKELPWGILTGIRPTKLVFQMLEDELSEEEIYHNMETEFLCSREKISTSIQIAKRERRLMQEIDYQNGYSLYIGIPFCPSTCLYCSFTSYSIEKFSDYVEAYLKALEKEIIYGATVFPDKKLTCVYFGGGTPTTLSAEQLDWLLGCVKKHFDFTYVKEFCVEAGRPDSITKEKLLVLKKWGVNRISINPQSMQQKTLDLIGRKHTVEQIKEAFALARATGHDNINMDMIIGLPGEETSDVSDTLAQIRELNPDSLTVHTLAIKRAARLNIEREIYIGMRPTDVHSMQEATVKFAKENDYLPYYLYRQKNMADNLENIGYARDCKEGLYNILIMEELQTILALGAGGLTKYVSHHPHYIVREDNVKSVTEYITRIDELIERKRKFFKEQRDCYFR
ncbi:MAG: coproporphyrinogen dehydrogenase HemZ [Lachnospiraceae bacterium]|nr:coproporphyrinogen dehydrogenase HemZ [Lachnospiraceae bacterium]